jgi:anti-anti-sigma regulatory factor
MFETWIRSSLDDPVAARRARTLNALALWLLLALAGLVVVALAAGQDEGAAFDARLGFLIGGIVGATVLAYVLSRQGALYPAVAVLETVLNVMLLALLGTLGSAGPVLAFVPFVVLATAALWSAHASVWLALTWSVIDLIVALAELGGFEPPLSQLGQAFPAALSISLGIVGFGLSGILGWLWAASALPHEVGEPVAVDAQPKMKEEPPAEGHQQAQETLSAAQPGDSPEPPSEDVADEPIPPVEPAEPPPSPRVPIPVVELFRGTVVMPVSGELDAELGAQLLSDLLQGIVEHDAQIVLLDVNHVPAIHETAAHSLGRVVAGADLMGAEVGLVGIGSHLAARLVELDVSLRGATAHPDMEAALRYALYRLGRISRPLLAAGAPLELPARQLESGNTTDH